MKKITLIIPFFLIACSDPVQSVDYYLEQLDEAEKVKEKCEVTQGSKEDQNCINADKALYRDYMSSKFGGY